jgi:hypothetical protein
MFQCRLRIRERQVGVKEALTPGPSPANGRGEKGKGISQGGRRGEAYWYLTLQPYGLVLAGASGLLASSAVRPPST